MLKAHLSAHVLALSLLATFPTECTPRLLQRVFQKQASMILRRQEFSIANSRGAERMHKSVLLDLDARPSTATIP